MQLFKAFDRSASLVKEVVRLEPAFATEEATLTALFAIPDPTASLPASLVALRRAATSCNWAEGLTAWNARAARQLQTMRQYGGEAATVRLLQRVFAADFGHTTLDSGLEATEATFAGDLLLGEARLSNALRLDGAKMLASVDLAGARVTHEITAEQAQFVGPLTMTDLSAGRAVRLGYSNFLSDVTVDRVDIGKELWLRNANVAGAFSMRDARLRRDVSLGACTYGGPVLLDGTRFDDTVSFEGAVFKDRLSLDGASFAARLWLTGITLSNGITFERTRFAGDIVPPLHDIVPIRSPQRDLVERLRRRDSR